MSTVRSIAWEVGTYQIQHRHLHHTLVKVSRLVLDDLDRHHFLRFHILTFHHLSKCSLPQDVEDEVAVPASSAGVDGNGVDLLVAHFLAPKNVIHV